MSTPRTISFRIAADKVAELDSIAKAMDRDRSYLLNEAVASYLSEQQRFVAMVNEGLERRPRGDEPSSHEEVVRMVDEWERRANEVFWSGRYRQQKHLERGTRIHCRRKARPAPLRCAAGFSQLQSSRVGQMPYSRAHRPRGGNARSSRARHRLHRCLRDFAHAVEIVGIMARSARVA